MVDSNHSAQTHVATPVIHSEATSSIGRGSQKLFSVGTLRYTSAGLVALFVWLLWGDFVFWLLDQDLPLVFPLVLNELGAKDDLNALLVKSIPATLTFLLAPVISVGSDRMRSRWGRRIPYLMWSTPLVGLFMILIGCHMDLATAVIGAGESGMFMGFQVCRMTMGLIVISVLLIGFDFVNVFVNTIYWYLFNDIVPQKMMARFMSLFRIVTYIATILYNKLVMPHALTHFRLIFILGGIAYTIGFVMMCLFIKEGTYPPPAPLILQSNRWGDIWRTFSEAVSKRWHVFLSSSPGRRVAGGIVAVLVLIPLAGAVAVMGTLCVVLCALEYTTVGAFRWLWWRVLIADPARYTPFASGVSKRFAAFTNSAMTYGKECFTHRFYWYFFLATSFQVFSWTSSAAFRLLRDTKSLKLSMEEVGDVLAVGALITIFISYPIGWLADKLHPVRVYVVSSILVLLPLMGQSVWIFTDFAHLTFGPWSLGPWTIGPWNGNLAYLYLQSTVFVPIYGIQRLTELPMSMLLLPHDRYGQFNSARAMLNSMALIFGTYLAGKFMVGLESYAGMDEWRYRYYPIWTMFFQIPGLVFLVLMYRVWKSRGGATGFTPPET